jgi:hypothetical protein
MRLIRITGFGGLQGQASLAPASVEPTQEPPEPEYPVQPSRPVADSRLASAAAQLPLADVQLRGDLLRPGPGPGEQCRSQDHRIRLPVGHQGSSDPGDPAQCHVRRQRSRKLPSRQTIQIGRRHPAVKQFAEWHLRAGPPAPGRNRTRQGPYPAAATPEPAPCPGQPRTRPHRSARSSRYRHRAAPASGCSGPAARREPRNSQFHGETRYREPVPGSQARRPWCQCGIPLSDSLIRAAGQPV